MLGARSHLEASILASLEPGIGCLRSGAQGRLSAYRWLLCGHTSYTEPSSPKSKSRASDDA